MSATEAYLAALKTGDDGALERAASEVEDTEGPAALARCFEARLAQVEARGGDVAAAKRELADVSEEAARTGGAAAAAAAVRACVLRREEPRDEAGADRAAALALELVAADDAALERITGALGGKESAMEAVARRLKTPEVKREAPLIASLRRLLSRLAERAGDTDRAFFEMLRGVRKAPEDALYVDEVFRLALATERFDELAAVFRELASQEALSERQRATLCNKVGHLCERGLDDPEAALEAYRRSVELQPQSKGARRHVQRLERLVGKAPAAPPPPPEDDDEEGEIALDDEDVLEATARERSSTTVGAPPPLPSEEGPPASGLALHTTEAPALASEVATVEGAGAAVPVHEPSLAFSDAAPAPDDEAAAAAVEQRHSPFAEEEGEGSPTSKTGGEEASTVLELPHEASTLPAPDHEGVDSPEGSEERAVEHRAPAPVSAEEEATAAEDSVEDEAVVEAMEGAEEDTTETPSSREAQPTVVAPAPSNRAPRTTMADGGRDLFAEAGAMLSGEDPSACVDTGQDLLEHPDKGSLPLRLATHALRLAASESVRERAVDLFVEEAPSQGTLAASLAQELWEELDEEARLAVLPVWVAAARVGGDEGELARAFLEPFATKDAPHGMAFRQLDQSFTARGDVAARDALWRGALEATAAEERQRRRAILVGHVRLLADAERHQDTLPLYERLVLEVAPEDSALRERAVAAWERFGAPAERSGFFQRLSKSLEGPEAIAVLRRLLDDRRKADDGEGVEAAARSLLERNRSDGAALEALSVQLASAPGRTGELSEVYATRRDLAQSRGDEGEAVKLVREHAAALEALGEEGEAREVLRRGALELQGDDALAAEAMEALEKAGEDTALLTFIEDLVRHLDDDARRVELLLKGADVARARLKKLTRAQEFIERALEIQDDHVGALLARADLAQELGDAQGALAPLERLAAQVDDKAERARVHYRIGRLLEDHLLRPEDAWKRYKAAVEGNPRRKDAWEAMRALARRREDPAGHVEALFGLAVATDDVSGRAALYREAAALERDALGDLPAAERALRLALEADPADEDTFDQLVALVVSTVRGETDARAALLAGDEDVLTALTEPLGLVVEAAARAGRTPAFELRRIAALDAARRGERQHARAAFEELLKEQPTDLITLQGYARLLGGKAGRDAEAQARRLRLLETLLLHHAPDLPELERVRLWGDVGASRLAASEESSARKALKQALVLAVSEELQGALSKEAVAAAVRCLGGAKGPERDAKLVVDALRLDASRNTGEEAARRLVEAAEVAREELGDVVFARRLLKAAVKAAPDERSAHKSLVDLEVAEGNAEAAIASTRALVERELGSRRLAELHLQLTELLRTTNRDEEAAEHLKKALRHDPQSRAVMDAAESFFAEKKDAEGLAALYQAQLKGLAKDNVSGRVALLERLAQVRRYDLRDLPGAVEALLAIHALDPEAIKPREDAARLYTELGQWREAAQCWREVLERDPLATEAWRGLFALYARTGQGDEAFALASAMASVEIASGEMVRTVKTLRPPFPRWPRAPKDPVRLRRKLGHPLEATPIRLVLDMVGLRLHSALSRPLKEFGVSKKERLLERQVPPSVLLAIRTVREMVGLEEMPPLYRGSLGQSDPLAPPFALLPAAEPGLVISEDALRGGMTPERAFALGRAMAWLMPHAILASTQPPARIKEVLEALTVRFLPGAEVEGDPRTLEPLGHELEHEIFRSLPAKRGEAVRRGLLQALKDYVHAREQVHVADWSAGVSYTSDRLGFLLAGDLTPAVRVIKSAAGKSQQLGARLAIKELVLFSVSGPYFSLRRELGLALPDAAAAPVLELE